MYSTDLILKLYTFMNLIFILLLLSHDYTLYLFLIQMISLYMGLGTIECMIEGNCRFQVIWIFLLNFLTNIISFILLRGFFPKTMKKIKKIEKTLKEIPIILKEKINF